MTAELDRVTAECDQSGATAKHAARIETLLSQLRFAGLVKHSAEAARVQIERLAPLFDTAPIAGDQGAAASRGRYTPESDRLLRCRKMTRRATSRHYAVQQIGEFGTAFGIAMSGRSLGIRG